MKLLIENFRRFLNEGIDIDVGDVPWHNVLRMALSSYQQAKTVGGHLGVKNFDNVFLLKLYEYWREPVSPDDDSDFGDMYVEHGLNENPEVQKIFNLALKKFEELNVVKYNPQTKKGRELDPREQHLYDEFYSLLQRMRGDMPDIQGFPENWRKSGCGPIPGETLQDARTRKCPK